MRVLRLCRAHKGLSRAESGHTSGCGTGIVHPWASLLACRDAAALTAWLEVWDTHQTPTGHSALPKARPRILVSGCLLGLPVTYRGAPSGWAAKRAADVDMLHSPPLHILLELLWRRLGLVECVPFCPEMQWLQLTAPRHPVRTVQRAVTGMGAPEDAQGPVVVDSTSGKPLWDYESNKLLATPRKARSRALPENLESPSAPFPPARPGARVEMDAWLASMDGLIVKAKSPSCGLGDSRLYTAPVTPVSAAGCHSGHERAPHAFESVDGFFVKAVKDALASQPGDEPRLPIESEKRLRSSPGTPAAGDRMASLVAFMDAVAARAAWRLRRSEHEKDAPLERHDGTTTLS